MGQGQAKLTDGLDVSKRELADANERCRALEAQIAMLKSEVTQAAQTLQQSKAALQQAGRAHEQLVDSYDAELSKAVKQRQLAEELRRSDALLAKRIMCAQKLAQGVVAPKADGAMAAQFALAVQDELQLRQVAPAHVLWTHQTAAILLGCTLLQTRLQLGTQLESGRTLEQARIQQVRRELCDSIWLAEECHVSLVVRSTDLMVLGGLRMPHQSPGQLERNGISPGLAVLRYFGDSSMQAYPLPSWQYVYQPLTRTLTSLGRSVRCWTRPWRA
jgi:hypothetical protein